MSNTKFSTVSPDADVKMVNCAPKYTTKVIVWCDNIGLLLLIYLRLDLWCVILYYVHVR